MRYFAPLILIIALPLLSFGQSEIGIFLGATGYQGDLVKTSFSARGAGVTGGLLYKYYVTDKVALRGSANIGNYSGDDAFFDSERDRGYSFFADFFDASAVVEYSFFGKGKYSSTGLFERVISPYVYMGVGYLKTDPVVDTNGRFEVDSEDQNPKNNYATLPAGFGLKYDLNSRVNIAGEFSARYPFSDLIDGISASGDPSNSDWYWTTGVTLLYKLGKN